MKLFTKVKIIILIFIVFIPLHAVCVEMTSMEPDVLDENEKKLELHSFNFHQDFEDIDLFLNWTSNGTYSINFKGLTSEKASSGTKSFKLDITFNTATYVYYKIPVRIPTPSYGELSLKGDIWISRIENSAVSLGSSVSIYPAPKSGINVIGWQKKNSQKWVTQSIDLINSNQKKAESLISKYYANAHTSDTGVWTTLIGLYLSGSPGSRITVYIDNLNITGFVPSGEDYGNISKEKWNDYLYSTQKILDQFNKESASLDDQTREIIQSASEKNILTPEEYDYITAAIAEKNNSDSIISYPWNPMSREQILPDTFPIPTEMGDTIIMRGCVDEFEPSSFIIRAKKDLKNVILDSSDLVNQEDQVIDTDNINIRLVKCWYQASRSVGNKNERILVPELLLKNDNLVRIDTKEKKNYLLVNLNEKEQYIDITSTSAQLPETATFFDSDKLLPFDLNENENKQIWISVKIPPGTEPGSYKGKITIRNQENNSELTSLHLIFEVLPFSLSAPLLDYGLYYRGVLKNENPSVVNSEKKSLDQYKIELINMKEHGVVYPSLYQGDTDMEMLRQSLFIRRELGLPKDKLFVLAVGTSNASSDNGLELLFSRIEKWKKVISEFDYQQLYIYGKDEAKGDELLSQRDAMQVAHKAGAKVFVSCYEGAVDIVGDLLDLPVIGGPFKKDEVSKWHSLSKYVYIYGNPLAVIEDPDIFRRNYGFALLCSQYDGAMNYAYQHSFGHIWNDYDHSKYRDHVFAYPTSKGVIDTVQWEGFREGVDDVRYLTTLLEKMGSVIDSELCELINQESDLDAVRGQIIDRIVKLNLVPPFLMIK